MEIQGTSTVSMVLDEIRGSLYCATVHYLFNKVKVADPARLDVRMSVFVFVAVPRPFRVNDDQDLKIETASATSSFDDP